jgi:hypothetical protein
VGGWGRREERVAYHRDSACAVERGAGLLQIDQRVLSRSTINTKTATADVDLLPHGSHAGGGPLFGGDEVAAVAPRPAS